MNKQSRTDLAASVHQRLLNISRQRGEDPNPILIRYALERFLYRLSRSEVAARFVLKGAMLFAVWTRKTHRPTKDLDLLGFGELTDRAITEAFQQVMRTEVVPDGVEFHPSSIKITEIQEAQAYPGKRIKLSATVGKATVTLQIDIGFGDVITPEAREVDYPTLLEFPAPHIRAYPCETVVAEKLQTMISFDMTISRMKDFFDLWVISKQFAFDGATLAKAIKATFGRRR